MAKDKKDYAGGNQLMVVFISLIIFGAVFVFMLKTDIISINKKIDSKFSWECSKTETFLNYTLVDTHFDSREFCDGKHCDTEEMAIAYLGVDNPTPNDCQDKCHEEYKVEIMEGSRPFLHFFNQTNCIQEELVIKEEYKDTNYLMEKKWE